MKQCSRWLIGDEARSFSLTSHYWDQSNPVMQCFLPFVQREKMLLTSLECQKLFELTYLNDEFPFGKVDMDSTVGMVSTSVSYNERFSVEVNRALNIISNVPEIFALLSKVIRSFVPLSNVSAKNNLRKDGSGKSCHWLKGAVFLSLPEGHPHSDLELALNIVHELGHQVLMIYQDADVILTDIYRPIYSSIRKTERPAIMSFHALVAIYFMLYFFRSLLALPKQWTLKEKIYLEMKVKCLCSDFASGSFSLRKVDFSQLGLFLMREMIDVSLLMKAA